MWLSLGFVTFILLNSLLLAEFISGNNRLTLIFLFLSAVNLILLTLICQKIDSKDYETL